MCICINFIFYLANLVFSYYMRIELWIVLVTVLIYNTYHDNKYTKM